jgi:hypothetical protein
MRPKLLTTCSSLPPLKGSIFLIQAYPRLPPWAKFTAALAGWNLSSKLYTQPRLSSTGQTTVRIRKLTASSSKPKTWCTGEDSNLRSSQGAADLQSAAINHSATCAHSTPNQRPSASLRAGYGGRLPGRRFAEPSLIEGCARNASLPLHHARTRRVKKTSMIVKEPHANRSPAKLRNSHATSVARPQKSVSCCWNQFSRRAARLVWLAPATRRCGRRALVAILELAKGFEPPTL